MMCPVCRKVMIVVEYHQVELDYCHNCKGVLFDSGELELFMQSANLESPELVMKDILTSPEMRSSHKERKCPICGQRMKETVLGEPAIHIDACRQGDGLWFDGGELSELLGQLAKPSTGAESEQPVLTFLGEVFKVSE